MENVQVLKSDLAITSRHVVSLESILMWLIVCITYLGLAVVLVGKDRTWETCCWLGAIVSKVLYG